MILKHLNAKSLLAACMILPLAGCSSEENGVENSLQLGTGTVAWNAPVARTDNTTPLSPSEIGGYKVYYGRSSGDYTRSVKVLDSSAQETTVTALEGLYYYVVTCLDTEGRESAFSEEFSILISSDIT